MTLNKKIIIALIAIALVIPGAYLFENFSKGQALKAATVIKVQEDSNLVALLGVDVLRKLNEQEFPGDEDSKGPSLLYAMGAAGIGEFNEIEIKGLNNKAVFRASRNEISRDYILCFTERGTVNLCLKNDYQHFLVKDVSEINKLN